VDVPLFRFLWCGMGFLGGAIVGSFLNVCIYRLPAGLAVYSPSRSFCPECGAPIPFWENIPLVSWVLLRGRCAKCAKPIPIRYFLVEALTAFLFAGAFWQMGSPDFDAFAVTVCRCILFSLLVVAAFVDAEHMIIPDAISIGGTVAGVCLGAVLPGVHGEEIWWMGAKRAVLGATAGFGLLWGVREGGRMLFGKMRFVFESPQTVTWKRKETGTFVYIGDEETLWEEFFFRGTETISMKVEAGAYSEGDLPGGKWTWSQRELHAGSRSIDLEKVDSVEARVTELTLPREVMGLGDVKLMAAIGSFLGWKAVLFVLTAGASLGAFAGAVGALIGRRDWAARIPFGPYLAMGAVWWAFAGQATLRMYWQMLGGGRV
jgi:leader peptidase (prepilin peptidase)/N-methyltransferase